MSSNDDDKWGSQSEPSNQGGGRGQSGSRHSNDNADYFTESVSFVDELGIKDLRRPLVDGRGRKFSAAGRNSPVAEFTDEFVVLHPPQKPFQEGDQGPAEEIMLEMDESGVLLNEFGGRKNIPGAKFNGQPLFYFWEQRPGTLKHYAVWFDEQGHHHYLTVEGERLTTDVIYKLRNMTHDGEL